MNIVYFIDLQRKQSPLGVMTADIVNCVWPMEDLLKQTSLIHMTQMQLKDYKRSHAPFLVTWKNTIYSKPVLIEP